jgi:asparagine synthase (glutamine-hydrolysing)
MPGIAGIISRKPAAESARLVKTMVASMRHESFYATGNFAAPELGVCAGWVAHENSFAAKQVFYNEQKDIALIFSGECFVDAEAKNQLRQNGHSFSEMGGDCLVHLYEKSSEKFFEKLNGLFSGLLIDQRSRKVFLFNDRYGMERIYWHETKDAFYFASEAKALLRILPELREFDPEGVTQFLTFGSTLDWGTLFRGIRILPGGSLWKFADGKCAREKYFSPTAWESQPILTAEDFEAKFSEIFNKILPQYFVTESKIGIALTGGLDTRMIMACRPKNSHDQTCYTFAGKEGETTLDDKIASRVAAACGVEHQLLRLRSDFFSDFAVHADRTVYVTDGTFGIFGAHEIYFHREARRLSAWRLTGNYGGEVLRGVSTYKPLRLAPELFNADLASDITATTGQLAAHRTKTHPDTFASFKEIPWNLFGSVAAGRSQVTFRTPYLDNEIVALAYQTPPELRKSSLAAARFIHANNPAMSGIPTDRGFACHNFGPTFLARRIFAEVTFKMDYYYNEGLPRKLSAFDPAYNFFAAKMKLTGWHKYLHYSRWLRDELAAYVKKKIPAAQNSKFWRLDFLKTMSAQHLAGHKNFAPEINVVLTLEAVERLLFRELPRGLEN